MAYYVFDDNKCKAEGMTKEEVLAAIAQATGKSAGDIDAAVITKIQERNKNKNLKFWVGSQAEYNRLSAKEDDTYYLITDPSKEQDVDARLGQHETALAEHETRLTAAEGTVTEHETRLAAVETAVTKKVECEIGEKNGWRYEKYSNGLYKCYRKDYVTDDDLEILNVGGANTWSIDLPINLGAFNYRVFATPIRYAEYIGWYGCVTAAGGSGTFDDHIEFTFEYLNKNGGKKKGVGFDIMVIGRWK